MKLLRYLEGKKTDIAVALAGLVEVLYVFGHLDMAQRDALLKLVGGAGAATFLAKLNRMAEALKAANNTYRGK